MSYIPDYRKDADKLTDLDKAYWQGYHNAMEDSKNNLENSFDNIEKDVPEELREEFETLTECSEVECMCSLVENNEAYENVEFTDANPPLYTNTKGANK